LASVVRKRKVKRAAVQVNMTDLVAFELDCGGTPGGELCPYAGPRRDLVEDSGRG
jgi:hypothetical protein